MTHACGAEGARIAGLTCLLAAALLAGCAAPRGPTPEYFWIVHDRERTDADRVIDQRRRPEKLLEFYEVRPGMRVLDLSAGRGYNTELLARVVGPTGVVYAQRSRISNSNKAATAAFEERLKKPVMRRVVHLVRELEDPAPPEVRDLDLVTFNFNYHDTVWMGVDRAKMNRAVFGALRPGGAYVIADHSGRPGTGANETRTLHRIEEAVVRREVLAAGFRLEAEGDFLRNPADPRDAPVSKSQIANDGFVLRFVKP
jgi:predicted methyltransferase